jgi:hypothetical protein
MQELLYAASREGGPMKEGQRYWAGFAVLQIQSQLCQAQMKHILQQHAKGNPAAIESGALLLVHILTPSTRLLVSGCICQHFANVHSARQKACKSGLLALII